MGYIFPNYATDAVIREKQVRGRSSMLLIVCFCASQKNQLLKFLGLRQKVHHNIKPSTIQYPVSSYEEKSLSNTPPFSWRYNCYDRQQKTRDKLHLKEGPTRWGSSASVPWQPWKWARYGFLGSPVMLKFIVVGVGELKNGRKKCEMYWVINISTSNAIDNTMIYST